ncbi:hypothetical protein TNCV_1759901 [Trichonephila clavipes]|nr:hypothetical protein TNCV_1759901 [Trichonephila clavipes]
MSLTPYSQPLDRVKLSESRLMTPYYSFPVFYTPVYVLFCPGKKCSKMGRIDKWYSRSSTAPETHTVKRALHCPFTDCTTGTVIQLGGNLN